MPFPRFIVPAVVLLAALAGRAAAQDAPRLIDVDPFDRLTIKQGETEKIDDAKRIWKLQPLEMKKRRPLTNEDPDEKLRVRLFDRATPQYEIAWKNIERIQLYEELVLEEAAALVAAGDFDQAYEYYRFLEQRDAKFPGVSDAFAAALFAEAQQWRQQGDLEQALTLLNEVYRRDKEFADLQAALSPVVDGLAAAHISAGRYAAVRGLVRDLAQKFPEDPVVGARVAEMKSLAAAEVAAARTAQQAGQQRAAHEHAAKAVAILPDAEGAKALLDAIHKDYRVFVVGVTSMADAQERAAEDSWAALRQARLTDRLLAERSVVDGAATDGTSTDGAVTYASPLGKWQREENRLTFTLLEQARWSSGTAITAYDVARRIGELTDPDAPAFRPGLAERIAAVRVADARRVEFDLRGPQASIEPWLQTRLSSWGAIAGNTPGTGSYVVAAATDQETTYHTSPEYLGRVPDMASELVERRFGTSAAALAALVEGDIDVVDRVPPWEYARFSRNKAITIEPYAVPTVHVLVPHPRSALLASPAARRAIAYGINRQRILDDVLGIGGAADRGRVLAGPFPAASSGTGPAAPAYDPRLLLALWSAANERGAAAPATIQIAHPPTETARRTCRAIADQLQLEGQGLSVQLRELPHDSPRLADDQWDLLYVEWPAMDPVVDARRLLGDEGLSGPVSPWLEEALRGLTSAATPADAAKQLTAIERMVQDEWPVIPLWQVTEHLAARQGVSGVGTRPVTLYQNVEQWRN